MEGKLTFRSKTGNWLNAKWTQWIVVISFVVLTLWVDNLAYFLGLTYVFLLLWSESWEWNILGLKKPKDWKKEWLKAIAISVLLVIVVDIILTPILEAVFGAQPDISSLDGIRGNFLSYIIFIVFMWVVAAFGEEFVYRGLLVKRLGKLFGNTNAAFWIAVICSSILFGLAHRYQGISGMISTGIVGFIFGAIYLKNENRLWLTILSHGTYDSILISLIYLDFDHQVFGLLKNLLTKF